MNGNLNNGGEGSPFPEDGNNNYQGKTEKDVTDSVKGGAADGSAPSSSAHDCPSVSNGKDEDADDFFADNPAPAGEAPPASAGKAEGGKSGAKKFALWQKPDPEPGTKYSRSFRLALSAISCSVAVIFLSLGFLSGVLIATGYLIAEIALMVPLSKKFYLGDFLAYLGTVLLAIVFGAAAQFWSLVPFIMFFGLHPLANAFQLRYKVNKWLALAVKIIWFDVTLYVMYLLVFGGVLGANQGDSEFFAFVNDYIWLFIIVFGSLFLWVYDYFIFRTQIWVNLLVRKIKK